MGMQDSVMRDFASRSSGLRTRVIIKMQAPRENRGENYGNIEVVERQAPPADLFVRTRPV